MDKYGFILIKQIFTFYNIQPNSINYFQLVKFYLYNQTESAIKFQALLLKLTMQPLSQNIKSNHQQIQQKIYQQNRQSDSDNEQQFFQNAQGSSDLAVQNISPSKFNQQVMDENQQFRQSKIVQNVMTQEQSFQQILKQEILEGIEIQKQSSIIQQTSSIKILQPHQLSHENTQTTAENYSSPQMQRKVQEKILLPQKKQQNSPNKAIKKIQQDKPSNVKVLFRSLAAQSKYLQPNSPQLFTSQQSLLPNQVVCIQNNSTRVIMHMNKKIVPIPLTSVSNDSGKSTQKRATLPSVQCPYLLGKLIVTNYKIAYMDSLYPNTMTFCLPLNYIYKLQRTIQQSNGISYLQITFKTGLTLKLKYHQQQFSYSQKIRDIILTLIDKKLYAATDYGMQLTSKQMLCKRYAQKYFEYEKIKKVLQILDAAIVDNLEWKEMNGYPEKYVVPIKYIGRKNFDTRIVVLSYVYTVNNQKIGLWRTGLGISDPCEQQWVPKTKFYKKHYTLQIKNKGIGMSKTQTTRSIQIEGLYLLRQSYQKLHQVTYHSHQSNKWFSNICGTNWYQQIAIIMNEAQSVIQVLSSGTHITLLSETQARGAQISALVQLLLNPYYRTIEGFQVLIQKQFLHFGCPKPYKKDRQQDKSIILIQFFDCVYQFTHIYPLSFEFNQHYLVYLAEHVMSNKYGNFLYVTRQIRKQTERRQVLQKCVCIWQELKRKIQNDKKKFFQQQNIKNVNKKNNKKISVSPIHQIINYYIYFRNSFYIDHNESNIFELRNHGQVSKGIKCWSSYFTKKVYCSQSIKQQVLFCNQIQKRYLKIAYQHQQIKRRNQNMRKKLSQQFSKIIQKKQIIKQLKQLDLNQ